MKAVALLALTAVSIFIALSVSASEPQDDVAVKACEKFILSSINTPATYIRASLTVSDNRFPKPGVIVEFDSQNELGALIRSKALCLFAINDSGDTFRMTEVILTGPSSDSRRFNMQNSSLAIKRSQTKMTSSKAPAP